MTFSVSQKRIYIIVGLFAFAILAIVIRLFGVQIIDAEANRKAAAESRTISYNVMPRRGTIYDRNGNVLAYSKEARTIYADPTEVENAAETAGTLAQHLGGTASDYIDSLSDTSRRFVYIKRRVDMELANTIKAENLKGIYFQEDQKREYPYGRVAGQIIGACDIEGDGLCGLELYYDDILRGSTGKTVRQQGMYGMPIPGGIMQETSVIDGQDIMLTVDIELQQKLEDTLEAWNSQMGNTSMHGIISDPTNGEIYAAASLPLLNPGDLNSAEEGATDLKCISTTYEPGSTFKTISATAILEHGALTPDDEIFCPSTLQADEYYIKDAKERGSLTYTFRQIIEQSSNVGISLSTQRLGFDKFYQKIKQYKMNERTGVDYPGDTSGYLSNVLDWSLIQSYNVSFGQGVTVTPLQTTKFYSALANGGVEETPHFLMRYLQSDSSEEFESTNVIDNKNAIPVMVDMLRGVCINGTGVLANIPGFGVAGKTGTGEIADSGGSYLSDAYYVSFVGFLSQASVPMLCFVGAEKAPTDSVVTNVWKEIMTATIERLKIAPMG